ncbi:MAG: hypothetical protein IPM79_03800 [Polyangiaceae bacterium]|nr:hypothetical protein [Polyangiaceae bacterium]MBK8936781.1 hypothetical protein [Polyangiaceae bacterium]
MTSDARRATVIACAALATFATACASGPAEEGAVVSIPAAPSADPSAHHPSASELMAQASTAATTSAAVGPKASPEALERAKEAFNRGVQAVQDGRYPDARKAFEEAYAAVPNHLVLYNLGQVQQMEGRQAEACQTFQRYLDQANPTTRAQHLPQLLTKCPGLR